MMSASHAEGRQLDPGQVYLKLPHFPYQAQIRSILANDTPQNSPPFLGQFDPTSPTKKRLRSELVVLNLKNNEKHDVGFT